MAFTYDGKVIAQIITLLTNQLTTYFGFSSSDLNISRSNQPTEQYAGARDTTKKYQIFITKVPGGVKIGQGFSDVYNESTNYTDRTYNHSVPGVYQFDFLANYDSADGSTDYEANDLAQLVSHICMEKDFIDKLHNVGIFIEKADEIRPQYIINDSDLYEMCPSFDLRLHYNSEYVKALPRVASIDGTVTQV